VAQKRGPFCCPNDQKVYLDTSFFREIENRFHGCSGKACQFSQAYVIAHEVGHHVQNLIDVLPNVQRQQQRADKAEANRLQVRVELQADCFAGVWANRENQRQKREGRPPFLEPGDVEAAMQTASAIGDDTLQRQATGRVVPDPSPTAPRRSVALVHDRLEGRQRRRLQYFRDKQYLGRPIQAVPMPGLDESKAFVPLHIAVLTVSDTSSTADDKSARQEGARRGAKAGHKVAARAIVPDDVENIRAQMQAWIADPAIDVIISTGGTGFTGRDVTPEAVEPLFEKKMEGFATLFLMVSYGKIGTSAIQTRAPLPASPGRPTSLPARLPGACKDAWDDILVHQLDYRYACNFVEIMPRLDEHLRAPGAGAA
jgi:molybdenum cofactor biosynthesis protein B